MLKGELKRGEASLISLLPLPHIKRESLKGRSPFKTYSSPSLVREGDKGGGLLTIKDQISRYALPEG
jgi:hypothetical protein